MTLAVEQDEALDERGSLHGLGQVTDLVKKLARATYLRKPPSDKNSTPVLRQNTLILKTQAWSLHTNRSCSLPDHTLPHTHPDRPYHHLLIDEDGTLTASTSIVL